MVLLQTIKSPLMCLHVLMPSGRSCIFYPHPESEAFKNILSYYDWGFLCSTYYNSKIAHRKKIIFFWNLFCVCLLMPRANASGFFFLDAFDYILQNTNHTCSEGSVLWFSSHSSFSLVWGFLSIVLFWRYILHPGSLSHQGLSDASSMSQNLSPDLSTCVLASIIVF